MFVTLQAVLDFNSWDILRDKHPFMACHQLYCVSHAVITLVQTWSLEPGDLLTCLRFLDLNEHLLSSILITMTISTL